LFEAFIAKSERHSRFLDIYQKFLSYFSIEKEIGSTDLSAISELVTAMFDVGVTTDSYRDVVDSVLIAWDRVKSPRYLDWATDTCDLLLLHPCADEAKRKEFFMEVWESCLKFFRRVTPFQRHFIELLAEDYEVEVVFPVEKREDEEEDRDEEDYAKRFEGKTLGIYTLRESVGRQAKSRLEKLFPGLRVELDHSHGGNDRLKSMSENMDFFVVCTQSAKHAATGYIEQNRPKGRLILYPKGGGASSIVNEMLACRA
jgi:hypothetical protein